MKLKLLSATLLSLLLILTCPSWAKTTRAGKTHHVIHATARPYRAVGHAAKIISIASFDAFDATVIDPIGVGLQAVADFLDMTVADPLEKLPEPFETVGDGVHFLYVGIDFVGTQLAK